MKLQLGVATLALALTPFAFAQDDLGYFTFNTYGTTLNITSSSEIGYDQNQNHATGSSPNATLDHTTVHTVGNRWSAYPLPTADGSPIDIYEDSVLQFSFTLNQETDKGFNAICLDADTEYTGSNGMCFVLSTTQGWIDSAINVAEMTLVGETTEHSIPIGHYLTGPVSYLAIIQDSDGTNRNLGDSALTNLELVQISRNKLGIEIDSTMEYLENVQYSYNTIGSSGQDRADWLMEISEDGLGVQVNDNQWKALALNAPYTITHTTVLEFTVEVSEPAEFHAVCLDDDLETPSDGTDPCVTFHHPDDWENILTTELQAGVSTPLAIPFGQILKLLEGDTLTANYLVFVQDKDSGDKRGGRSTFSNFRLYDEERMPLTVSVFGANVTVPNIQDSMTNSNSDSYVQDSIDHVMSVSTDGLSLTSFGNSWKRLKFPTTFEVSKSTMMRFTFEATVEAEGHLVCLLNANEINAQDGRSDCFAVSGKDIGSSTSSYKVIEQTANGATKTYDVLIGSYFTGTVGYLGIGQDNDKAYTSSRAEGQSTISNIEIYSLPSLNIGLDAGSFAIENNQVSYDQSQDNTPIRDHLLTISSDGSSITTTGNKWRALPVVPAKTSDELGDFVVSFDYQLTAPAEFHGLCFEDNKEFGDPDDPKDTGYDPKRCLLLNGFDVNEDYFFPAHQPAIGDSYRYVANLGKLFERFYNLNYVVLVQDNDADKSGGEMKISNIHITTDLTSCLGSANFDFTLSDCTIDNFLSGVEDEMVAKGSCAHTDPLIELMALFDATRETDVYKRINYICSSSYETSELDFAKTIHSESQVVGEYIDGGTILNYESGTDSLAKDGAGIGLTDQYSTSHLLTMPKHHALDQCDVGAAMCCWVDSRSSSAFAPDADVCYVDMKASRYTAHVKDGYSIYGDTAEKVVKCQGFAWGTDSGSVSSALKGNALFKVGFVDHFYDGLAGNVEQVPGSPMCGCMDRMPVVTDAGCTKANMVDGTSTVDVTYTAATESLSAKFNMGTVEYSDCGDLKTYYKTLDVEESDKVYIDTRIVGDGNCHLSIEGFLSRKKGLTTLA